VPTQSTVKNQFLKRKTKLAKIEKEPDQALPAQVPEMICHHSYQQGCNQKLIRISSKTGHWYTINYCTADVGSTVVVTCQKSKAQTSVSTLNLQ